MEKRVSSPHAPITLRQYEFLLEKIDRRYRDMLTMIEMINARLTDLERIIHPPPSQTEE